MNSIQKIINFSFILCLLLSSCHQESISLEKQNEMDEIMMSVNEFIESIKQNDFVTVYQLFTPNTQLVIITDIGSLDFSFMSRHTDELKRLFEEEKALLKFNDNLQTGDYSYIFHDFMIANLKFDNQEIILVNEIEKVFQTKIDENHAEVILFMKNENIQSFTIMLIKVGDLWRIDWISENEIKPENKPWSSSLFRPATAKKIYDANTFYSDLDLTDPEITTQQFLYYFKEKEFSKSFQIIHPETQKNWILAMDNGLWFNILSSSPESNQRFLELNERYHGIPAFDFEAKMLTAIENNVLLYDLSGSYKIIDIKVRDGYSFIIIKFDNIESEVEFQLDQSFDDKWRIKSIQVVDLGIKLIGD